MSSIDYSKWDNLDSSEDKQDSDNGATNDWSSAGAAVGAGPRDEHTAAVAKSSSAAAGCGAQEASSENTRPGVAERCEYRVTLHPDDDGTGLDPVFLEDSRTFVPAKHEEYSATLGAPVRWKWGLPDPNHADACSFQARASREMQIDLLYKFGELDRPEQQFVSILCKRKRRELEKAREKRRKKNGGRGDENRDLVLHIYMVDPLSALKTLNPSIYRRVRLSSQLKLSTLADKILTPLMGWVRNYHCYYFCDLYDGAMWCPQEHGANDMVHFQARVGGDSLPPSKTSIGELLRRVGDKVAWAHDLGDNYTHIIELEEIIKDESEVHGKCVVLGGAMRCPYEDGDGICKYQEEVLDLHFEALKNPLDDELQRRRADVMHDTRKWLNVLGRFDPEVFSVEKTQLAIDKALRSRASTLTGPKQFTQHLWDTRRCSPGQELHVAKVSTDTEIWTTMSEVVNIKQDPRDEAVCVCGNPTELMQCSRCGVMWYCSKHCQANDWPVHKKDCKLFKSQLEKFTSQKDGSSNVHDEPAVHLPLIKPLSREEKLRLQVGNRVECRVGDKEYAKGRIVAIDYREPGWPLSAEAAPYQVKLEGGPLIFAPIDDDYWVRALPARGDHGSKATKKGRRRK